MKYPKAAWNPENPWDSEDPAFRGILQDEWHGSEQMSMADDRAGAGRAPPDVWLLP